MRRCAFATWTAEAGDKSTARHLFETLHADATRLFDDEHWLAVDVRTGLEQL